MNQIILPRFGYGGDWGAKRRVIAVQEMHGLDTKVPDHTVLLFIVGGSKTPVGARGFGRQYNPAQLVLRIKNRWKGHGHETVWLAKGRISKATIVEHAKDIDEAFGGDIAKALDPRTTTWVRADGTLKETTCAQA